MRKLEPTLWTAATLLIAACSPRIQRADQSFRVRDLPPAYAKGAGPVIQVDEAHGNYHTAAGRYRPFAQVLRAAGYRVVRGNREFTQATLRRGRGLVIANALARRNLGSGNWSLPTPSAFTDAEILAVKKWVHDGGSLLLIADHMPFPGAAARLAAAFGVTFSNGFVLRSRRPRGRILFHLADGSLRRHPVLDTAPPGKTVTRVMTFTGSAFRVQGSHAPLLVLFAGATSLEPRTAWKFSAKTRRRPVGGWLQGALLRRGKGRVAVFAEGAMFTAQRTARGRPLGLNVPAARQNRQLLLNVMRWLLPPLNPRP